MQSIEIEETVDREETTREKRREYARHYWANRTEEQKEASREYMRKYHVKKRSLQNRNVESPNDTYLEAKRPSKKRATLETRNYYPGNTVFIF